MNSPPRAATLPCPRPSDQSGRTTANNTVFKRERGPVRLRLRDEHEAKTDRRRLRPAFRDQSALEAERGRGVPLMLALVDEVEFVSETGGTRVRLRRNAA
jgi:anti-sigma regulatory factor (Ser/Thr protein kinase)